MPKLTPAQKRMLSKAVDAYEGAVPMLRSGERGTARVLERLGLMRRSPRWPAAACTVDYAYITDAGRAAHAALVRK